MDAGALVLATNSSTGGAPPASSIAAPCSSVITSVTASVTASVSASVVVAAPIPVVGDDDGKGDDGEASSAPLEGQGLLVLGQGTIWQGQGTTAVTNKKRKLPS